jgi:hypothetical protein
MSASFALSTRYPVEIDKPLSATASQYPEGPKSLVPGVGYGAGARCFEYTEKTPNGGAPAARKNAPKKPRRTTGALVASDDAEATFEFAVPEPQAVLVATIAPAMRTQIDHAIRRNTPCGRELPTANTLVCSPAWLVNPGSS